MRSINGERDPLERPMTRRALQEDLAKSGKSQKELGDKYGVRQPSIAAFKKRHQEKINQIIDEAGDKFAGILIARQEARLEMYNEMAERLMEAGDHKSVALAQRALRAVAEELGHLPGRVTLSGEVGTRNTYELPGTTSEDFT